MNVTMEQLLASQLPELFKYTPLDSAERISHLKDILTNNRLWCANPVSFNDPFDLRPFQDFETSEFRDDYFKYFRIVLQQQSPLASAIAIDAQIDTAYQGLLATPNHHSHLHNMVRKGGICCLTENSNNLLMWAHYTRGHNGYVLKFNNPNWTTVEKAISYRVEYDEKYPTVDLWKPYFESLKPTDERNRQVYFEFTQIAALRKSPHWAYEKEWRIIRPEPGFVTFDPGNLTQIVFGVAVQQEVVEEIRQLALQKQPTIQLFKAELDKNTFNINYVPI